MVIIHCHWVKNFLFFSI